MNAVYVRDPMCVVRGGAVIGRMGPLMRRGEERYATQSVAALGMPILRTIPGTGTLEGGTVVKITPRMYAFGASIRCNPEGARQLAEVLAPLGIELIVVPLAGWSIHLDGHLSMVDRDKALCDVRRLPYWFIDRLRELGIELIEVLPEEDWAINGLVVRPGRLVLSEGQPRTVERLGRRGVEVVEVAVRRDPAGRRRHPLHDDGAPARARRLSSDSRPGGARMRSIDLTTVALGPTEFGRWAALNGPLGLGAFGVNVVEAEPDSGVEIAHDETESGQQELFVVISGRARFAVGGETFEAGPGTAIGIGDPGAHARLRGARGRDARALRRRPGARRPARWGDWIGGGEG